jgi:hypothetical protein
VAGCVAGCVAGSEPRTTRLWRAWRALSPTQFESPRKLVRDRTHERAPADITRWLLFQAPQRQSVSYEGWRRKAIERLAFSIPFEIEGSNDETIVVLKGSRTSAIPISFDFPTLEDAIFAALSEAAGWIYQSRRDAETKFLFLNNHLGLDWKEG